MLIDMADHRGEGLDQVGSPAPSSPKKMITVGDQIPRRGAGAHQSCPSPLVPAAQRSPCFPPPAFRQAHNYGHLILHFGDGATRISGLVYRGRRTGAANPRLGGRLASAKKRNPFCQPDCASPDPEPVGHHCLSAGFRVLTLAAKGARETLEPLSALKPPVVSLDPVNLPEHALRTICGPPARERPTSDDLAAAFAYGVYLLNYKAEFSAASAVFGRMGGCSH